MVTTKSPINIAAALGLALGAGLVMAAALLAKKYFRTGHDLIAAAEQGRPHRDIAT